MGRPKSRQAPRTTMSIRVSERERRQIEEKAVATGMTPSAYIRTMLLESGNVDTTIHDDRQKLMHELSAIGNNINQIARMANTNVFISKSDVQDVKEQLRQIQQRKCRFCYLFFYIVMAYFVGHYLSKELSGLDRSLLR